MKRTIPFYILTGMLLLWSCQPKVTAVVQQVQIEATPEDSTVFAHRFLKGSGLGGSSLTFNNDSTFSQIDFCDICPKSSNTYGYYVEDANKITLVDTIWYNVALEDGAKSFDFSDKRKKYNTRILNKTYLAGKLVLSEHPELLKRGFVYKKMK